MPHIGDQIDFPTQRVRINILTRNVKNGVQKQNTKEAETSQPEIRVALFSIDTIRGALSSLKPCTPGIWSDQNSTFLRLGDKALLIENYSSSRGELFKIKL